MKKFNQNIINSLLIIGLVVLVGGGCSQVNDAINSNKTINVSIANANTTTANSNAAANTNVSANANSNVAANSSANANTSVSQSNNINVNTQPKAAEDIDETARKDADLKSKIEESLKSAGCKDAWVSVRNGKATIYGTVFNRIKDTCIEAARKVTPDVEDKLAKGY